jgi:hypothetical protein
MKRNRFHEVTLSQVTENIFPPLQFRKNVYELVRVFSLQVHQFTLPHTRSLRLSGGCSGERTPVAPAKARAADAAFLRLNS